MSKVCINFAQEANCTNYVQQEYFLLLVFKNVNCKLSGETLHCRLLL